MPKKKKIETAEAPTNDATKGSMTERHHHNLSYASTLLKAQKSKVYEEISVSAYADDAALWKHYIGWLHTDIRPDESVEEIQAQVFGLMADTLIRNDPDYSKHLAKEKKAKEKQERADKKKGKGAAANP